MLLILGSVLGAGCTSTTTSDQANTDDKYVGAWTITDGDVVNIIVLEKNGIGYTVVLANDEYTRTLDYSPLTWKAGSNNTLILTLDKVSTPYTMKYDVGTETLIDEEGKVITKMDPITGVWFTEAFEMGSNRYESTIINQDGTGFQCHISEDGEVYVYNFNWKNNGDNSYDVVFTDGEEAIYYLNDAKDTIHCSYGFTFTKEFADSYYYMSVLGPWYNKELDQVLAFGADEKGIMRKGETIDMFTWTSPEFGKIQIHWITGDSSGKDEFWMYDGEKNILTSSDGDITYSRPVTDVNGVSIEILPFNPDLLN